MVLMFTLGCPICSTRRFLTDNSNLGIVPIIPCVTRKTKGYNDILFRINNKIDLLNFSIRVRIFVMYGRKTFTLNFGFDKIYLEDRVCMELLFISFRIIRSTCKIKLPFRCYVVRYKFNSLH